MTLTLPSLRQAQGKLGLGQAWLSPSTLRLRSGQAQLRVTMLLTVVLCVKDGLRPFDCAQGRQRSVLRQAQDDNGVDSRFKCQRGYSTLGQAQSRLTQPFDPSTALRTGSAQGDNVVDSSVIC